MPRFPIGTPLESDLGGFDFLIEELRADIFRDRDPFAPPPEKEADPLLVPRAMFDTVMSTEIMRQVNALGIRQDAESMAFNSRVQAAREVASAPFEQFRSRPPPKPRHPTFSADQIDAWLVAVEGAQAQVQKALAQMRITDPNVTAPPLSIFTPPSPIPAAELGEPLTVATSLREAALASPQVQMESTSFIEGALALLGDAFDGKRQVTSLVGYTVAAWEAAGLPSNRRQYATFEERRSTATEEAVEIIESNRPLELIVDEASVGNLAILFATGGMSELFAATGHTTIASALSLINKPIRAGRLVVPGAPLIVPREAAAIVLSRIGYEQTEGYHPLIRLGVGAGGLVLGASPESIISPSVRAIRQTSSLVRGVNALADEAALREIAPGAFEVSRQRFGTAPVRGLAGAAPDQGILPGNRVPRPIDPTDPLSRPAVIAHEVPDDLNRGPDFAARGGIRNAERFLPENATMEARALDLAGQDGKAVPRGIADAIVRGRSLITDVGNKLHRTVNQSTDILHVRQAYALQTAVEGDVATRLAGGRLEIVTKIETAFGGLDDAPNAVYNGPVIRTQGVNGRLTTVPAEEYYGAGKLWDVYENPSSYDLTPEQKALIQAADRRNTEVSDYVNVMYGGDVGQFRGNLPQGGARTGSFLPIIKKGGDPSQAPASGISGRLRERTRWNSLTAVVQDSTFNPDEFDFETNLRLLFTEMDDAKTLLAGRETFRHAVGGVTEETFRTLSAPQQRALREVEGLGVHLPIDEAKAVEPLIARFGNGVLDFVNIWRQTRLNADLSPFTIHGSLAVFADPEGTMAEAARLMLGRGLIGEQFTSKMTARSLANAVAENPESWLDFSFYTGLAARKGTPEEFATTLIERIPLPGAAPVGRTITRFNEAAFTLLLRSQKTQFDELVATHIRRGVNPVDAKVAAGDVVRMVVPIVSPRDLGLGAKRTALERAAFTSISFIRQPATFMKEAATGYAKLMFKAPGEVIPGDALSNWARLTPTEAMAAQKFATVQGSIAGITTLSAVLTANERNVTVAEAIRDSVNPMSDTFYYLWVTPDLKIPLGGPLRGMMKAIAPRDRDLGFGPVPVPFHGFTPGADPETSVGGFVPGFFDNRITPVVGSALDLIENEDFFGEQIRSGQGPQQLLDSVLFAGEQIVPLSVGTGIEGVRRGLPVQDILVEAGGGALGQNLGFVSEFEQLERDRRRSAGAFRGESIEALRTAGMTEAQAIAAEGFTDLDDLRKRMGTRAANAFVEANSDAFSELLADYIQELERRKSQGDETAAALLIGAETQADLDALATSDRVVTVVDGETSVDLEAYRHGRADRMLIQRGELNQNQEIFERLRKSPIEIDRLTARYYELFDAADDGRGGIDFDLFNTLEQEFAANHPDLFPLIEANALSAPRGANPLELKLRQDRIAFSQTGLWEIRETAWEQWKSVVGPEVVGDASDFGELFNNFVAELDVKLKGGRSTAELFTKIVFADDSAPFAAYGELVKIGQREWIAKVDPELARAALNWGYIDGTATMEAAVLAAEQAAAAESDNPEPLNLNPEATLDMAEQFVAGQSFGEIAGNFNITPDAVEQRLRRLARDRGFENASAMRNDATA